MIYRVDFSHPFFTQILVKQKDTSRVLDFQLLDNGKIMDLTGKSVIGYLRKPDGHQVMSTFDIVGEKSGIVSIQFTNQMLAVAGTGVLEIVVYDTDNKEISSMLINITIEESIRNGDEIESTNEFTALSDAIAKMLAAEAILNDNGASLEARYTATLADINNVLAGHTTKIQEVHDLAERCSRDIGEVSDLTTLKSVLGLLNGTGGRIKIKAGTYTPTETFIIPDGVTIDGNNRVRFICDEDTVNCIFLNKVDGATSYLGAGNINIRGIEFDGNDTINQITPVVFGHARNVEINNCYFHNFNNWHFIEINGCYNWRIKDCRFANYGTVAGGNPTEAIQIDIMNSSTCFPWSTVYDNTICQWGIIDNCDFNNIYGKCIGNHTYVDTKMHNNITIRNCWCNVCEFFVKLSDIWSLKIYDNFALETAGFCHIDEHGDTNYSYDIWLHDNNYTGTLSTNTFDWSQHDYRFFRGYPTSAPITGVHIYNNAIKQVPYHAIAFTGHDAQIHDNFIENVGKHGIYMYGGNNNNIHDNFINNVNRKDGNWSHICIGANTDPNFPAWRCNVHDNIAQTIEIGFNAISNKVINNTCSRVVNNSSNNTNVVSGNTPQSATK